MVGAGARVLEFLRECVAPRAAQIDVSADALAEVLQEMQGLDLMALRRPLAYGGPELSESEFRTFQTEAARASGTFAFLQTQHQSAAGMIARSENAALRDTYLPHMGNGDRTVGIGFSQLRRPGPPMLRATPGEDGGYILDGEIPWVTGFGYFQEVLIGALNPDGEAIFGIIPLQASDRIQISPPMRLAAMETARTVAMRVENLPLPPDQVAFVRPVGWIARNDRINVALQGHFAIGCAQAALDSLQVAASRKPLPAIAKTHAALMKEWEQVRVVLNSYSDEASEETTPERLAARADAIDLMMRCAQAAVIASSGAANALTHPAQRVYRESLVFAVSAQTADIMAEGLKRTVRD